MTIAIGVVATDGIVMAADTQETFGDFKGAESKLLIANHGTEKDGGGGIATTGAGQAGYLDCVNQEICMAFLKRKTWKPLPLLTALKKQVKRFHDDHIVPYALFPEHDRPQIELIIGAHVGNLRCLWVTEKGTVSAGRNHCAVGIGRAYAQGMLRRFWTPMDTVRAASLAAYVVFHVKNFVEGCGNETQIVIVKNGHAAYLSQDNINLLEYAFGERTKLENQLLHFGLGLDIPDGDIKFTLARFSSMLTKDRKDVIDCQKFSMSSHHRGK